MIIAKWNEYDYKEDKLVKTYEEVFESPRDLVAGIIKLYFSTGDDYDSAIYKGVELDLGNNNMNRFELETHIRQQIKEIDKI